MNSLKVAALVSSVVLVFSGAAVANDAGKDTAYQSISKRPYVQAAHIDKRDQASQWEGATLQKHDQANQLGIQHAVAVRKVHLHMLAKRPYM